MLMLERFRDETIGRELDLRGQGIRDDIAKRIRCVCGHLSEEDFAALVDSMTRVQLRGERRLA